MLLRSSVQDEVKSAVNLPVALQRHSATFVGWYLIQLGSFTVHSMAHFMDSAGLAMRNWLADPCNVLLSP